MKLKSKLTALLLLVICAFKNEDTLYKEIKSQVHLEYPGLETKNKLLLVSFISNEPNQQDLEIVKAVNRTLKVFKYARLNGGEHGILGIVVCNGSAKIFRETYKNLGLHEPLYFFCSYEEWTKRFGSGLQPGTLLFNKEGKVVNSQLSSETIFSTVHNRLTR